MLQCSTWAICGVGDGFLCAVTVSGQVAKKTESLTHFLWGGSYVVLLVNTNMCVARHVMLMMLLQLPGLWSGAAVAVVVADGCGF